MSELREIDKETRRARGAMLYKECMSCRDIRKILDDKAYATVSARDAIFPSSRFAIN
jgi:transposase